MKHLTLPNDSAIVLHFNKDAQWVTAANGAVLQLTPVADTGVAAGDYIKPGHQTERVGRHVLLDITEVGTCDTLITQLQRIRKTLETSTREAEQAHIEEMARTLAERKRAFDAKYGIPDKGPNHAHNFDNLQVEAPVNVAAGDFPEDMVKLARELNAALEQNA
ncbi:MAG: hypothetical protein ACRCXB_13630 [Aeromonadaceae bacterium]